MIRFVQFEETVADSVLTSALGAYPNEAILLLRGKVAREVILVNEVLIPPLATHGRGFSDFRGVMLPMDLRLVGVSHSHPSGVLRPSTHDLNHFYGRIMVITAYPFQSYSDIGVFNNQGEIIPHEVVADQSPQQDEPLI
jgi:proteasome lid subunit RPN8/RPN11